MIDKIYSEGYYLIYLDEGETQEILRPRKRMVFVESDLNFHVFDIERKWPSIVIPKADSNLVVDGSDQAYSESTLREFLQSNVGPVPEDGASYNFEFGQSLSLNGVDSELTDFSYDRSANWAIYFWAKPTGSNVLTPFVNSNAGDYNDSIILPSNPATVRVYDDTGAFESTGDGNGSFLNRKTHFGFVKSGNDLKFYINGNLELTSDVTGLTYSDIQTLGRASVYRYAGEINELVFVDPSYSPSDADATALYNGGDGDDARNVLGESNISNYYKCNQNNGDPVLTDTMGVQDATLNNLAIVPNYFPNWEFDFNTYLRCDGDDDHIDLPNISAIDSSPTLTISAWIRVPTGQNCGIGSINNNSIRNSFYVYDGVLYFDVRDGNSAYSTVNYDNYDEWAHVVLVFDGSLGTGANLRVKGYINEVLQDLTMNAQHPTELHSNARLNWYLGLIEVINDYSRADMNEISVFTQALTESEVSDLYNNGNGADARFATPYTPVAYWKCNEENGASTLIDSMGSYDGDHANFATPPAYHLLYDNESIADYGALHLWVAGDRVVNGDGTIMVPDTGLVGGIDMSTATSGTTPNYTASDINFNNQPTLDFDGVGDVLFADITEFRPDDNKGVFVSVFKIDGGTFGFTLMPADSSAITNYANQDSSTSNFYRSIYNQSGILRQYRGDSDVVTGSPVVVMANGCSGTGYHIWRDGEEEVITFISGANDGAVFLDDYSNLDKLSIGARLTSSPSYANITWALSAYLPYNDPSHIIDACLFLRNKYKGS